MGKSGTCSIEMCWHLATDRNRFVRAMKMFHVLKIVPDCSFDVSSSSKGKMV